MLLALVGVTGVGKSYFVNKISEKLNFEKVHTIRTRPVRSGENPKYFMSHEQLDQIDKDGKIAYRFEAFGGEYGYLKDEIFSKNNMIFEMHYSTIFDWKKVRPNIKTIYIMPSNINIAKQKAKERNLSIEKETERIKEIDDHYEAITTNQKLRSQFDYFITNNYNKDSEDIIIELVKEIMKKEKEL